MILFIFTFILKNRSTRCSVRIIIITIINIMLVQVGSVTVHDGDKGDKISLHLTGPYARSQ